MVSAMMTDDDSTPPLILPIVLPTLDTLGLWKLVKLILNFIFIKSYDPGYITLAVIVKTLFGT